MELDFDPCSGARGITQNLTLLGLTTLPFEKLTREKMGRKTDKGDDSGQLIKGVA
jgi:hypothetical protein